MAIPLITITGPLLAPNGVAAASGSIHVLASAPFSVMDGATPTLVAMGKLIRLVEGTGALPASFQVSPTPAGYWYEFRFDINDVDGVPHRWSQRYQIEASPATLPIASLTVYDPPPAGAATPLRLATATDVGMVKLDVDDGSKVAASAAALAAGLAMKVSAAGGDASATVVTPEDSTTARPMAEVAARAFGAVRGWSKVRVAFDFKSLPLTSANYPDPDDVLFDEVVETAPLGLTAVTERFHLLRITEKPDGLGGWLPTINLDANPPAYPGAPAVDAAGYMVRANMLADDFPTTYPVGAAPATDDGATSGSVGEGYGRDINLLHDPLVVNTTDEGTYSRVRVFAARSADVYTPEQIAAFDALGYRFRLIGFCADQVAKEWLVQIPATDGAQFIDEPFDRARYGVSNGKESGIFVAEILRGPDVDHLTPVRQYRAVQGTAGEAVDSPTYPMRIQILPAPASGVGTVWGDTNAGGGVFDPAACDLAYGNGTPSDLAAQFDPAPTNGQMLGGVWVGGACGNCGRDNIQRVQVTAWRSSARPTAYFRGEGTPGNVPDFVPVAAITEGNEWLRLRYLVATPNMVGVFPFKRYDDTAYKSIPARMSIAETAAAALAARVAALEAMVPPPEFTSATEPIASAAWVGKPIRVKDPGSPTLYRECCETAAGGYVWVTYATSEI